MQKEKIATYISLVASVLVLLSVVIPHHHHDDGTPCYRWLAEAVADTGGSSSSENSHTQHSHGGACLGHNQALFSSEEHHAVSDAHFYPLLVLFDFIDLQKIFAVMSPAYGRERTFYIESLHDSWIAKASGLRAPPPAASTGKL